MKKIVGVLFFFLSLALSLGATVALAKRGIGGEQRMPVEYYGSASSATTGTTALIFSVPGLTAAMSCVVTVSAYGTGPTSWTKAVESANVLTLTVNANQTALSTTINYVCFKP